MKIVVYSDCHLYAPHSVLKKNPEIEMELFTPTTTMLKYGAAKVFLTGDIVDTDNAKKKNIRICRDLIDELKEIHGDSYASGNHECVDGSPYYIKHDNILICHGHTLFWDMDKVRKWENKKGGMSYWRYKAYQWFKHSGRNGKQLGLSGEKASEIATIAKSYNCDTIIFGHTHRAYDEVYAGVRIINVPKGRTILDV